MGKMLSTFLFISASVVLSLTLVACGDGEKEKPKTETAPATQVIQPDESLTSITPTEVVTPSSEAQSPSAEPVVDTEQPEASQPEAKDVPVSQQQFTRTDQMLALARRSGCLACHSVDKKVVGPAWKEVAKRYKGSNEARDRLIAKVSNGGRGNWTEIVGNVAMPPYFPRVTKEDISRLVDFILSLQEN